MTFYLVDTNVLKEMCPRGNANVSAWHRSVDDSDIRLSVITTYEIRKGWESKKKNAKTDVERDQASVKLGRVEQMEAEYGQRIIPIDVKVAAEWARLMGAKEKNLQDTALAATARLHGLVVVTRNVKDFVGRDVDVLDPFKSPARIVRV